MKPALTGGYAKISIACDNGNGVSMEAHMDARGPELWMIIRTDIHNNVYLIREGLTKDEADEFMQVFIARHTKPHGQDYASISYTKETRSREIKERQIKIM